MAWNLTVKREFGVAPPPPTAPNVPEAVEPHKRYDRTADRGRDMHPDRNPVRMQPRIR